jgi:hypothetical protein
MAIVLLLATPAPASAVEGAVEGEAGSGARWRQTISSKRLGSIAAVAVVVLILVAASCSSNEDLRTVKSTSHNPNAPSHLPPGPAMKAVRAGLARPAARNGDGSILATYIQVTNVLVTVRGSSDTDSCQARMGVRA